MATTITSGVRYSGIWTLTQVNAAISAGTWTGLPYLYSWGQNTYGQLGLGNTTNYSSPKQVGSLTTWLKIASGTYHTISVKTDGTLWTWGLNNVGQLGLGNTTYYSSPKQVGALTTWSAVVCGSFYTIATKTDGTLWTWGQNNVGQLGLGDVTIRSSPNQVGALTTWSAIAAGASHTIATKTDGTLWTWGFNNNGQLGLGNITNYSSPKQVGALTTWLAIAAGDYHTIARKTDGTLWTWGKNTEGQLGIGNTTSYSSPKQVGALTTWLTIAGGRYFHTIARKTDGTLWTWGYNAYGQLGLGNTTNYSSPKQVGALTTWSAIAGGGVNRTIATKTDGTLWTWGRNNLGQLGLGNVTNYSSPKQVGALTTWSAIAAGAYHTLGIATP